jgi:hypothetical protein
MNTKFVLLFGHRKQSGKDVCADITKKILSRHSISHCHTSFAKHLKLHAAARYNLDVNQMGDDVYKNSTPPHLGGKTVREVLIEEGRNARSIWEDVWAFQAYTEIIESNASVGIISDYRFPNESLCFDACSNMLFKDQEIAKPNLAKILVFRKDGKFVSDGADDQLPDIDSHWDHIIHNDDNTSEWKINLENQLNNVLKYYIEGCT